MELKEFIAATLTDIVNGVIEAQENTMETFAQINPLVSNGGGVDTQRNRAVVDVIFDIALGENTRSGASGKIGVVLASVGLGGKIEEARETDSANRVRFKVPVMFPLHGQKRNAKEN